MKTLQIDERELLMVKFGGSLITDKDSPYTARPERIKSLVQQIKNYKQEHPDTRLIIGHGSGSFGHMTATMHQTRNGVISPSNWQGFTDVWWDARRLNTIVLDSLKQENFPVISYPVSSGALTQNHKISHWPLDLLQNALAHNLIPVVYGDVVMDSEIGGTILSTEEIFYYLTPVLKPTRIILLGIEPGVWSDFPVKSTIIPTITPENFHNIVQSIKGSASTDVTGGMIEKVKTMLALVQTSPQLQIQICAGDNDVNLYRALNGEKIGTRITN